MLLTVTSVPSGLAVDDHILRVGALGHPAVPGTPRSALDLFGFIDGAPEHMAAVVHRIAGVWTIQPDLRLNFFRPLSSLTHAVDYRLWPDQAWLMHAQNLVWYGLLIALVGMYYRRILGSGWMPGAAVVLFALDDAHGVTVGWISNRNALIAGVFGLLALMAYHRVEREGWRPGRWLGPTCFLLSLLSAEAGIAIAAYLFSYTVFLSRGRWLRRSLALLPYALVVIGWRIAYSAAGRGAFGSDSYIDPGQDPVAFVAAATQRLPALLLSQFALPPSDVLAFLSDAGQWYLMVAAVLVLTTMGILGRRLLRESATCRFWAVGTVLAAVPLCATYPSDRLLVFVGIGAFGFLIEWCDHLAKATAGGSTRGLSRVVALVVLMHAVLAPLLLPVRALTLAGVDVAMANVDDSLPRDPALRDQQLVIVDAPDVLMSVYVMLRRASLGDVLPDSIRVLSMANAVDEVTRDDPRTLTLHLRHGLHRRPIDRLLHSRRYPHQVGDVVRLEGFEATVLEVDRDGPTRIRFRFDDPLEHPRLRWVIWQGARYETFVPPPVGQTLSIRAGVPTEP